MLTMPEPAPGRAARRPARHPGQGPRRGGGARRRRGPRRRGAAPSWACRCGRAGSACAAPTKDVVGELDVPVHGRRQRDPRRATSSCSTPTARPWSPPSAPTRCSRPRSRARRRRRVKRGQARRRARCPTSSTGCADGGRERDRPPRPGRAAHAEGRGEPALLRRRPGHGGRARGRRLGRTCAAGATTSAGRSSSPSPTTSGMGVLGLRAWSPEALERRVAAVEAAGPRRGLDRRRPRPRPSYRFRDPDGHASSSTTSASATSRPPHLRPSLKNQPQRYIGRGCAVKRLDHVNVLAADVRANREFCVDALGYRLYERDRARRRQRGRRVDERVDRRARADLHARRPRRPRPPAPPRLLGRHARGVPARRRHLARRTASRSRRRRPSTRSRRASSSTASSPAATGSRSPPAATSSTPPTSRASCGPRRAGQGPGLGRQDRGELPHLRHAAARLTYSAARQTTVASSSSSSPLASSTARWTLRTVSAAEPSSESSAACATSS